MPEKKAQSGMTLVEILVAMVMMGIIITGVYNLFRAHNLMAAKQEETTMMQQELLSAMVQMADDLRMCGYSNSTASTTGFNATSNATVVICTKDFDLSSNSTLLGFRLNTVNNTLDYINATGGWEPAAINISNLTLTYFDIDGNNIANITGATAGLIRSIGVTATAIAAPARAGLNIGNRTMNTRVYCRNTGL
ncbi:MAG: prepilin-type N-terminal cleavage/methylation domain-containing protein [Desulfomicrobium sp.]|nr:prepilin-type N-terminal cleavage/methylation domain-containing protein [Desulfomicrobium sp.]